MAPGNTVCLPRRRSLRSWIAREQDRKGTEAPPRVAQAARDRPWTRHVRRLDCLWRAAIRKGLQGRFPARDFTPPSSSKSSVKGCASSDMWKARAHALPELSALNDYETSLIP